MNSHELNFILFGGEHKMIKEIKLFTNDMFIYNIKTSTWKKVE